MLRATPPKHITATLKVLYRIERMDTSVREIVCDTAPNYKALFRLEHCVVLSVEYNGRWDEDMISSVM